ncbi:MAG: 2-oxoglutarate and iron-dependent oxygenase domain-containing protein [Dinoroseobacter sp.]|nr:2-oxoglutarate and iron-dependent oxygenase domain-containing protein [Dinoroseobacter sp.]
MNLPLVDWTAPDRAQEIGTAARDTGFFLLHGHGISDALISDVFAAGAAFFALPEAEKRALAIGADNRGWAAEGTEQLDPSGAPDRKEAFNMGLDLAADDPRVLRGEPFRGVNKWPELPGFTDTLRRYFDVVHALGVDVMGAVAEDLALPSDYFDSSFDAPIATLRLLSYPAANPDQQVGAGAHSDYGALTFLLTDGVPGLQVKTRAGNWLDVPHVPGAYVVNIGDCLMRWSNDVYVSTPHRVLPPPAPRMSVAFFLDPNPDAKIASLPGTGTPKYPETTGAAYLRERLEATYG